MQAEIGPVGEEGGDTSSFEICTPSGLARRFDSERRPFWARATLIVRTFSGESVGSALSQFVRSVSGEDWHDVATKLDRFLDWETANRPLQARRWGVAASSTAPLSSVSRAGTGVSPR